MVTKKSKLDPAFSKAEEKNTKVDKLVDSCYASAVEEFVERIADETDVSAQNLMAIMDTCLNNAAQKIAELYRDDIKSVASLLNADKHAPNNTDPRGMKWFCGQIKSEMKHSVSSAIAYKVSIELNKVAKGSLDPKVSDLLWMTGKPIAAFVTKLQGIAIGYLQRFDYKGEDVAMYWVEYEEAFEAAIQKAVKPLLTEFFTGQVAISGKASTSKEDDAHAARLDEAKSEDDADSSADDGSIPDN